MARLDQMSDIASNLLNMEYSFLQLKEQTIHADAAGKLFAATTGKFLQPDSLYKLFKKTYIGS